MLVKYLEEWYHLLLCGQVGQHIAQLLRLSLTRSYAVMPSSKSRLLVE